MRILLATTRTTTTIRVLQSLLYRTSRKKKRTRHSICLSNSIVVADPLLRCRTKRPTIQPTVYTRTRPANCPFPLSIPFSTTFLRLRVGLSVRWKKRVQHTRHPGPLPHTPTNIRCVLFGSRCPLIVLSVCRWNCTFVCMFANCPCESRM